MVLIALLIHLRKGWALALITFLFCSCTKEAEQFEEIKIKPPLKGYKITARLDNKQSGTESLATGLFTGTYNEGSKKLTYKLDFEGLVPKFIKIKKGPRGANGTLVYQLPKDSVVSYTSGMVGVKTLTALQERDLIRGICFIVIETEKFPVQEIRGQITLKSE